MIPKSLRKDLLRRFKRDLRKRDVGMIGFFTYAEQGGPEADIRSFVICDRNDPDQAKGMEAIADDLKSKFK